jgi:5-methyltetrahydrofolate--homocysteine methyltransferase
MTLAGHPWRFTIVGENLHTSRVVLRTGQRVRVLEDGTEGVRFRDEAGQTRYLTVPSWAHDSPEYQQGQIKHVLIAVHKGLSPKSDDQEEGAAYVRAEVRRQVDAGADYLDLNVDEVATTLDVQKAAMRWLVGVVQEASPRPLCLDSSSTAIIQEGLRAYDRRAGRPLINSASLERLDALDLARTGDAAVVVTAAGRGSLPADAPARVANVAAVLGHARGIPLDDLHVDPLVLPISVDVQHGRHFLDAVRAIRGAYGPAIHITGGLSNVSFGLPNRKLVNQTFTALAIDAGVDGAIMDPVQARLADILGLDRTSEPCALAGAMLLGDDDYCVNYLRAWREGRLGGEGVAHTERGHAAR